MVQQKYHSLTTEATEEMEKAFASTTAYREHEPKQNEWILLDTPKNAKLFAEQQLVMAQQQKLAAEQQKLVGQQQKIAAEDQKRAMTDSSLNENDRKKMAEQNNVLDQQKKKLDEQKAELEHQKKLMDEDKKKAEDKRNEIKNKNLTTTVHTNTNVNIERVVDYAKGYTFTGLSYAVNANDDATSGHKYKNTAEKNLNVEQLNNNVITDLKVNNIISTTTNLSYQLTNDQLIVNDKIQPVAIQQQLKAKYIKNPDWKLMYNFKLK